MTPLRPPPIPEQPDSATSPGARPNRRRLTLRRLGLINWAVVGVAVVAFVATRPIDSGRAPVAVPGASFYALGSATPGLQVGQPAPELVGQSSGAIRLMDLDGLPIALADLRGRPVWIVFWATWCPPCQSETPDLRAAYEAHRKDGLVLIAIDLQEPADVVRAYVEKFGLTYRIGLDQTGAVSATYGVFGLPTHYFIDRQGVIRDRNFGPLTRDQMEARIAALVQ